MKTTVGSTSTCKNTFLQDDGFCVMCGKNHFEQKSRRTSPIYRNPLATTPKPEVKPYIPPTPPAPPAPVTVKASEARNFVYHPAPAKPTPQTTQKVDRERLFRIAAETIKILSELYPQVRVTITTSNRRRTSWYDRSKWEISFGYCVEAFYQNGYHSYRKTSTRIVANILGQTPTKENAVRIHAAHEFAHAMVHQIKGSVDMGHTDLFYQCFAEIIPLVG